MPDPIHRHLERRLPRYTSYPTAPHFSEAIGREDYRRWLGAVAPRTPVSLYLHIPFCRELCWFCGCNTRVVRKAEIVAQYAERLMAEIDLVADALPGNLPVGQVHFGGGSPNSLSPETLTQVVERLDKRFWLGQDTEVAVELDPRTTGRRRSGCCGSCRRTVLSISTARLSACGRRAGRSSAPSPRCSTAIWRTVRARRSTPSRCDSSRNDCQTQSSPVEQCAWTRGSSPRVTVIY
jgi:oxygen-independent coproporphyrinogen-3 oxidase